MINPKLYDAYKLSPIVAQTLNAGGDEADCVNILLHQNAILVERIIKIQSIIPRKIKLDNGTIMIYRCPDELIPLTEQYKPREHKK